MVEQVHQKNSPHASGMICSGRQTVLMARLTALHAGTVIRVLDSIPKGGKHQLNISEKGVKVSSATDKNRSEAVTFQRIGGAEFNYTERLGYKHELFIIGGGHCALALSELMSKLDFRLTVLDDRPDLNTLGKNCFAHEIRQIESYEIVGELIPSGRDVYIVVMTLGYASDTVVIRALVGKDVKYLGVLGSRAKMKVLLKTLEKAGVEPAQLSRIRTPIGLPINSHSPEEIAVSIAAEIISIKNA